MKAEVTWDLMKHSLLTMFGRLGSYQAHFFNHAKWMNNTLTSLNKLKFHRTLIEMFRESHTQGHSHISTLLYITQPHLYIRNIYTQINASTYTCVHTHTDMCMHTHTHTRTHTHRETKLPARNLI